MKKIQDHKYLDGVEIKTDIVIVGYGPVGAALAVYLGKLGVSTVVIEKNLEILQMPRAIALDNEALRVLQKIGLADDSFDKIIIDKVQMYCPFIGEFAEINTSGRIDKLPKLVTFYQPDLERSLRAKVEKYENIRVLLGAEFLSFEEQLGAVQIMIKDAEGIQQTIKAKYLVGADGANSKIRTAIGMDFKGESYSEDWLIVDAKNRQGKAIDHIEFICDPKRPIPHMPAPGGRERWEFMLNINETREEMERPAKIQELLKPWLDESGIEIERQAVYRFHARCCDRFQKGRVFLVGDAAHITPPFVGQGLVAGLRDIANLGWKLQVALRSGNAKMLLETYDQERRPHAKKMIQLAQGMGLMVMPQNKMKAIAIHGLIKSLGLFPLTKKYFTELRVKPQIRYKEGFFQPKKSFSKIAKTTIEAGKQINQITLKNEQGQLIKSDDCWGDTIVLVGIGTDPKTFINEELQQQWKALDGKIITILAQSDSENINGLIDIEQQWTAQISHPYVAILRPDGIVYDVCTLEKMTMALTHCIDQLA